MRVVPSVAVSAISQIFPWSVLPTARSITLGPDHAPAVAAVLELVDAIPTELLPRRAEQVATYLHALGRIRGALRVWSGGGHPAHAPQLAPVGELGTHPIAFLVSVLKQCPDQAPPLATTQLTFVNDGAVRESLMLDAAEAARAHGNGDFKSATVLAGSVIEALLLWSVDQKPDVEVKNAIASWDKPSPRAKEPTSRWSLYECIEVAHRLGIISKETRDATMIAKNYRNLIHPAAAQRTGITCSIGTSYSALGAMEETIRELTAHFEPSGTINDGAGV